MKKLIALLLLISALFTLSACGEDEVSYVEICFEDYGSCVVLINHTAAPITANNFITLVNEGFYDGLTIHRVIEDFIIILFVDSEGIFEPSDFWRVILDISFNLYGVEKYWAFFGLHL